ncbi:MAG: hypothetical protein ACOYEV_09100 [Candidatus Nanopelagicales bacterium]
MSPRGSARFWPTSRPRIEVAGGVAVPKPGSVTGDLATELVSAAVMEARPGILSRARTYARAGQVMAVQAADQQFTAEIQGTARKPYQVSLRRISISGSPRVAADCDCPYGCDLDWCKHAAALAYVAAHLLDRDPTTRARWSGEAVEEPRPARGKSRPESGPPVFRASALVMDDSLVAELRTPIERFDVDAIRERAAAIVPLPEP